MQRPQTLMQRLQVKPARNHGNFFLVDLFWVPGFQESYGRAEGVAVHRLPDLGQPQSPFQSDQRLRQFGPIFASLPGS